MSDSTQRTIAIGVAILIGMLGAIQVADQATLGLSPRIVAWLAIIGTALGILQGFLPAIHKTPPADAPSDALMDARFVDAVSTALLAKRAEQIKARYPDGPTPGSLISKRPTWIPATQAPNERTSATMTMPVLPPGAMMT